jgi:hypothetical protein
MVKSVNFITEVMLPFAINKFLIEGLFKSEISNFEAEKIIFKINNIELGGDRSWFGEGRGIKVEKITPQIQQIPLIGVPGGFLGIHAFYVIFENFLRNLSKHQVKEIKELKNDQKIKINIKLEEDDENIFWKMEIYSSIPCGNCEEVKKKIIEELEKGIIDEATGQFIPEAWGTKEMLIAADYLRGGSLEILQCQKDFKILEPDVKDGKYLSYKFKVLKPLTLGIHSSEKVDDLVKKELMRNGVWVFSDLPEIVPTEYLITQKKLEVWNGKYPLKIYKKQANFEDLINKNIFSFMIDLEKEFVQSLNSNLQKFGFIIFSSNPKDKQLCNENINQHLDSKIEILCDPQDEVLDSKLKNNYFLVIFDRHGAKKGMINNLWDGYKEKIFWEPYGGGTSTAFTLQILPPTQYQKLYLLWSLISSAFLKVAIIDERIQQHLKDKEWKYGTGPGIRALECLERMRIYIPSDNINLEAPKEDEIEAFIGEKKPHIVSIHAGILDKMGCKNPENVKNWVSNILGENGEVKRVIIHSGRGIPFNIPELEIPFIGFAPLEHWTTSKDLKSKYHLILELLAARGVKRR